MFKLQVILALAIIFVIGISADISDEKLNKAALLYCSKCSFDGSEALLQKISACVVMNAKDAYTTILEKIAAAVGNSDECVKALQAYDQKARTENSPALQTVHKCIDDNLSTDSAAKCKA